MVSQNKVFDALRTLGVEVPFAQANTWIKKKYGSGVSDHSFYTSRRVYRSKQGSVSVRELVSPAKVTVDMNVTNKSASETSNVKEVANDAPEIAISLAELLKVQRFAVEMGGRHRLQKILAALEDLSSLVS